MEAFDFRLIIKLFSQYSIVSKTVILEERQSEILRTFLIAITHLSNKENIFKGNFRGLAVT